MICPRCGANNDNSEQFCYNCGLRLDAQQQAQPQGGPLPPPPPAPPSYGGQQPYGQQPYGQQPPFGSQPPAYGGYQQPQYAPAQPTSTAAIVSLIAGIIAWVAFPVISAIVAVIAGHMARGEIRRSAGRVSGDGMALAGLILGYLNLLIFVGVICFVILVLLGTASTSP